MASGADPISAVANAAGSLFSAVGTIVSSGKQLKAAQAQADAQKYMSGQMTEQEYLRRMSAQESELTGLTSQVLSSKNETNYLPIVAVVGLFVVIAVMIIKKS